MVKYATKPDELSRLASRKYSLIYFMTTLLSRTFFTIIISIWIEWVLVGRRRHRWRRWAFWKFKIPFYGAFLWHCHHSLKARAKICPKWWGSGNELPKKRGAKMKIKDWKFKSDIKFNVAHFIVRRTIWNRSTRNVRRGRE